jgi:arylsulfatase A-like enzyme
MPRRPASLRPLPPLLLFALAACGTHEAPPAPLRPAVIDLIPLAASAEREPMEGPTGSQLIAIEADDDRDALQPLRCLSGHAFTFAGLHTKGAARLQFRCGSSRRAPPEGPALPFSVQAWREPRAEDAAPDAAWTRTLRAAELLPDGQAFELPLPGGGEASWSLRFSVGGAEGSDWPAFLAPRVVHEGGLAAGPLAVEHVIADLDARLAEASIVQQSEAQPVGRAFYDAAANYGIAGGRRAVISATAPARVRWKLVPPAGCALRFAVGLDTRTGWKQGGDGMRFSVEVDGERIWSLELDPHHLARDRGWKPASIDLARWAGREVALELVTEPGATPDFDTGGFAGVALVQRNAVPRLRAGEKPTIIVALIDTLRADRFGCYGSKAGLTPKLDALAARGLTFRGAHSTAPWTWPSTASLFTGLYPNAHGVVDDSRCLMVEALSTMAEQFQAAGYTTGGFSANHLVDAANRFDQGFETFVCEPNASARALAQRALDWVDATQGQARLLYLHFFDPHVPYAPPGRFAVKWPDDLPLDLKELGPRAEDPEVQRRIVAALFATYDGEVRYADDALGELLDALAARGELEDALVIVTADHGEEFVEHGLLAHGPHLYEETVAVPLILAGFGRLALPPGLRADPVSLIDVLPTLIEVAGLPDPPYPLPGHSLLAPPAPQPLYMQTFIGADPGLEGVLEKRAILQDGWKLIHTPERSRFELYDLRADPGELHDLAEQEPARRDALARQLEQWRTMTSARTPDNLVGPDAELIQRLQEMGYLGKPK